MSSNVPTFDLIPNWRPLEDLFSRDRCDDFMQMGRVGAIQLYKHRTTRRYLNIDGETGEFFRFDGEKYVAVNRDEALSAFRK